jgi:hypothetical protein
MLSGTRAYSRLPFLRGPKTPRYTLTEEEAEVLAEALHGPAPDKKIPMSREMIIIGVAARIATKRGNYEGWKDLYDRYKADYTLDWKAS